MKYTVEVTDPPPGWDDRDVEIRHRLIPADQLANACGALLDASYRLWIKADKPGKAAPTVTVRLVSSLSPSFFRKK